MLFQQYIESLSVHDLSVVEPLPDRRVLGEDEEARIWQRLEQVWGIAPKMRWYPLNKSWSSSEVIAFQEMWFAYEVGLEPLREMLRDHGVERLWELREAGINEQYEMEVVYLIPRNGGGEHG